jgi:import inner membrane translocase subunit TIM22
MSSSFAIEDPLRNTQFQNMGGKAKVKAVFTEMGKGMWKSGSGFAKVGALYAGSECVIEGVRSSSPSPSLAAFYALAPAEQQN